MKLPRQASATFTELSLAAREELTDPSRSTVVGKSTGEPRFELYQFGFSICSQKIRTVLTEKAQPYLAHELEPTENYRPGYVRLRLFAGGEEQQARLAEGHTMRSSVTSEGFDACVVPLLLDREKQRALVDSALILEYLEAELPEPPLIQSDPVVSASVRKQVGINDTIPHPGILYGFHAVDRRPQFWIAAMDGVYERKCAALERMLEANRDDPALVRAYNAKIAKERAGQRIQKDANSMAAVLEEFREILNKLDQQLESSTGEWVCGGEFTLADCVWAVSLYRIQWLGQAELWAPYPQVRDYAYRLYQRPSVRKAIIEWPSSMPTSPHTADVDGQS